MVTEDYVSFETAKLLKEKGFDEYTESCFVGEDWESPSPLTNSQLPDGRYSRPTLQMAMKWLREVHNIDIAIEPHLFKEKKATEYCFNYWIDEHYHMPYSESYPVYHPLYAKTWESYEEACGAAIKYCLEYLI